MTRTYMQELLFQHLQEALGDTVTLNEAINQKFYVWLHTLMLGGQMQSESAQAQDAASQEQAAQEAATQGTLGDEVEAAATDNRGMNQ